MKIWSFIGVLSFLCASETYAQHRIAFISDAHIQNIVDYPELVRSMEVQVQCIGRCCQAGDNLGGSSGRLDR